VPGQPGDISYTAQLSSGVNMQPISIREIVFGSSEDRSSLQMIVTIIVFISNERLITLLFFMIALLLSEHWWMVCKLLINMQQGQFCFNFLSDHCSFHTFIPMVIFPFLYC
jgi:hypothetical protein